ncbi:MAG: tyrosine-type recombinase/integrase, partial [Clostridia bacterium]
QERIPGNIAALVSLPKLHEKPIMHLIGEEIDRLLSVAEDGAQLTTVQQRYHNITKLRDYAILMLFLGTGIRVSECVGINIEDLDFQTNAVLVTRKGGNQVILYYPQEVSDALKAYLVQRQQIETDATNESALFLSLQKKRISQRAVQLMVKKYSAIAVPLKKRMSPHKLRSTYATRLYHETEDIYLVADALGHSDVNTTRKHYAAMSEQRRQQAAQNVHLPKSINDEHTENIEKTDPLE